MTDSQQNAVAVDIETVSPTLAPGQRPSFQSSRHFEILTVNVATVGADESITPRVFFREDSSPESELAVIESAIAWCTAQDPGVVYSYNGESFDFIHLARRPALAAESAGLEDAVTPTVEHFLRSTRSVDLKKPAWTQFGTYLTFEEAVSRATDQSVPETQWEAYDHGIDLAREREAAGRDPSPPELRNTDIPILGSRYLEYCDAGETSCAAFAELEAMLESYCTNDVIYQFELAAAFA